MSAETEAQRILAEYRRRGEGLGPDFYSLLRPGNLLIRHGVERALARGLVRAGRQPLAERKILEIGCGRGQWLSTLESFGAPREHLAGIELDPQRADDCARRFPGADIRLGDAAQLPWPDGSFDLVLQATVFTSILDSGVRQAVAGEMLRVLKPGGCLLWYDFLVNNPRNPHVRGVGRRELQGLFPGCTLELRRITLAPPLARRLAPWCWTLAWFLEGLRLFNTHYLALIRPASPLAPS